MDKPNFKTSDDEDDDDDNWGYNSQNSSNDEKEVLGVPGENSASDIDSFIDNLNKVYSGDPSGEVLPPIDHDLSLPDFENTSFSKYEDDEENYSPIKPLSISQQKEAHDDYLSSFSGRTQSVRKPPRHSTILLMISQVSPVMKLKMRQRSKRMILFRKILFQKLSKQMNSNLNKTNWVVIITLTWLRQNYIQWPPQDHCQLVNYLWTLHLRNNKNHKTKKV